jgi:UDP-N-acetylmuramoyl-tripeptide--D-alanyl-D-alanine ligase
VTWALAAVSALAAIPAGLRWLRVAQREHYLAGEVTRSAGRWRRAGMVNFVVELAGFAAMIAMILHDVRWGFAVAGIAAAWPIGLSVRGVTSPLAWTDRLRRLAAVTAVLLVVGLVLGGLADEPLVVVLPLFLLYAVVDVALWVLSPYERRHGEKWVDKAAAKIRSLDLDIVAITGSYGKTTTKNYVAHLLSGPRRVVASPASFNNRMGLARAINEGLTPGTEVFVAEMGTYGPGEIAELTLWIPPKVAAMVAIGPVHLERFGSVEAIVRAKEEILDRAEVGVICVDDPLLADVARRRRQEMPIVEVSAVGGIVVAGEEVIDAPAGVFAANLAVALGICHALGIGLDDVVARVVDLPGAEHRQSVSVGSGGFTIVDDTFNSNPAGARSALDTLARVSPGGKTAVVTPGMVELGPVQDQSNRDFAAEAANRVDHLVIVGRTNRNALRHGSANGKASVTVVDSRDQAVEWARATLGPGDAVLYENDLPDHYP